MLKPFINTSAGQRVLMLLQNAGYPIDGRVRLEARALVAAGHQVSVVAPSSPGEAWRETLEGVHIYRFPAPHRAIGPLGYLWEYGYSLAAIFIISFFVLIDKGFDIVHAHQPPDAFAFIALFYKLLGKRYVMDHHDLSPELYNVRFMGNGNRILFRVLVWLERLSFRLSDHVIATNQSYKQIEMTRGRVPEQCITIVRNGPYTNELHYVDPYPDLRKKKKVIIGYVGFIGRQDGVDYLLRALQYLACGLSQKGFICVIVGTGDALAGLKSLSQRLRISDHIIFAGFVRQRIDVARYLSSMDICVAPEPSNPYNDRSTAAKLMEYMALGKPIVAFDLPEHRFTAQDAAVYARSNDIQDFAKQIALLMNDPARCAEMGKKGRERIERVLAWQHQEIALLKAYKSIISHK